MTLTIVTQLSLESAGGRGFQTQVGHAAEKQGPRGAREEGRGRLGSQKAEVVCPGQAQALGSEPLPDPDTGPELAHRL